MKKQSIAFAFSLAHLWVLMVLFGAIFFETLIVYPNIFHDIPRSFEIGMKFMVVKGPHDFFPPVGLLSMFVGVGSLILNWRFKPVRNWILGSLIIIFLVEFIFSMLFFWPRNEIMFEEGVAVHSIAELKQVAFEFQLGHWFRVAGCAAAAMMSWMGFLKMERLKKDTQGA